MQNELNSGEFSGNSYERCHYARSTDDPNLMLVYAYDPDRMVRQSLAYNKNAAEDVLEVLADDPHPYVRQGVAMNPNTPVRILKMLSLDYSWEVGVSIMQNPNCPESLRRDLASTFNVSTDMSFDCEFEITEDVVPRDNVDPILEGVEDFCHSCGVDAYLTWDIIEENYEGYYQFRIYLECEFMQPSKADSLLKNVESFLTEYCDPFEAEWSYYGEDLLR